MFAKFSHSGRGGVARRPEHIVPPIFAGLQCFHAFIIGRTVRYCCLVDQTDTTQLTLRGYLVHLERGEGYIFSAMCVSTLKLS